MAGYNQGAGGRKPVVHPTKMYAMPGKEDPGLKGFTLDDEANTFRGELGTNGAGCGCWPLS